MKTQLMFLAALSMSAAALQAQQTWRVYAGGGPGIHFQDLPPAVAAASAGDTIMLIWGPQIPGGFLYSCNVTIDKPLTIVSASSYGMPGYSTPQRVPMIGRIDITGIAAGERVVLSNLGIYSGPSGGSPFPPHGIHAIDCAGELLFEDVFYRGGGMRDSSMHFERCDNVTLRACTFDLSGEAVTLTDSRMLITNCIIRWSWLSSWVLPSYWYTQTGPGLWIRNSHATVIASLVEGADRQTAVFPNLYASVGAYVESGSLDIGPFSLVRGGYSNGSRIWSYSMPSPTAGQVFVDPRAYPLYHPGATPWTIPANVYSTYHDWLVAGETYHVSVVGPPAGWGLLAVGSAAPAPVLIPGLGLLAMDPLSAAVMGLRQLDSVGWTQWTRQVPVNVPVGYPFVFQAAVLDPNGTISLTVPSPFTVAWPHGQIP